jgi:hypothetical protein
MVTGTTRCASSQTCVMPTFSPTIAFMAMLSLLLLVIAPGLADRTDGVTRCRRSRPTDCG